MPVSLRIAHTLTHADAIAPPNTPVVRADAIVTQKHARARQQRHHRDTPRHIAQHHATKTTPSHARVSFLRASRTSKSFARILNLRSLASDDIDGDGGKCRRDRGRADLRVDGSSDTLVASHMRRRRRRPRCATPPHDDRARATGAGATTARV